MSSNGLRSRRDATNGDRGRMRECEAHAWGNRPFAGASIGFQRPPQQLEAGGNVKVWLQRFEDYALDCGIPTESWSSAAVSLLSDGMYEIVRDNGLGRLSSFQQLSGFLKTRFCRPESAVERYLAFQRRKQSVAETAFVFGEAIRSLGRQAGITSDEVLRNQCITGLSSYKVVESLLCQPPETFDQAVEHAKRVEEAETLLKTMAATMSNDPKRPDSRTTGKRPESKTTSSQFFKLTTVDAVGRASTTALIGPLGDNSGAVSSDIVLLNVDGIVGGERQSILIDSGSAVTLVHKEAYRRWSEPPHVAATECSILAANGSSIPTIGVCRVQFCFGTKTVCHPAYIVEGVPLSCVIGADFLMQHGCVVDAKRQTLTVGEVSVPMRCNLTPPKVPTSDGSWGSPAFYSVLVDSSLPRPEQCKDDFRSLLNQYDDVFASGEDLGRTDVVQHRIDTGDSRPCRQPPRRIPFHQRQIVEEETQRMLRQGVIEPAHGPWASPVVLVRKKDGSYRFCVDYRRLNGITYKDAYPLPRIDDTLQLLGGAKWFSTLDLASGFWQVAVHPEDRVKTAFCTPTGLYQFKVMPFGLCNAPSTFQRLMEVILGSLRSTSCLVYLDDIIIHSRTEEEHVQRLREVFRRLRDAGLKLNMEKCQFFKKEVRYLGHVVSRDGVRVDPEKTEAVDNWPRPTSPKELKQFLGLASYYRRFVSSFATIAEPMNKLMKKSSRWNWTSECEASFHELKARLTSAPTLSFPDFNLPFVLDTDSSNCGLGAVLAQVVDGKEVVVAYASRSMSKAERRYSTTRQEMLALVWAVRHFRPYLYGKQFRARTDHNSLRWLQSFKEPEGQVARWLELLSSYNFEVEHRAGRKHGNADALSRVPDYVQKNSISIVNHLVKLRSWLPNVDAQEMLQAQRSDPEIGTVLEWTEKESWPEQSPTGANRALRYLWCQKGQFSIRGRLLYRRWVPVLPPGRGVTTWLLVIPKSLIPRLLESAHDGPAGGHLGGKKTFEKLRRSFYWPNQREDVANWCESCEACARRKSGGSKRPRAPLQQQCIGNPWERICLDFLGPFTETTAGNRYLLIVTDSFTKWTEAFPVRDMEGATTASVLVHEWFCRYGLPEEILSDQGRTFESELMKSVCVLLDVRKLRTSAYHAQGNGQVERFNRTLLGMLSVTAREQPFDWDEQVPLHLLAYRTSVHSSTGITPFQAVFGREAKLPADIMYGPPPEQADQMNMHVYASKLRGNLEAAYARARKYIGQAQKRQKELFDKRVNFKPLCAGELVWLLDPSRITGKLYQSWTGPFKVVEVVGMVNYKIQRVDRPSLTMVVHYDRLKRSHQRQPHLNEPRNSPELERSVLNRPQRHRRRPATLEGFVDIA
uniref:RNA-directed DNA polymerase n=1 Tax=Trichuris muris TaxID=70415 RepID=A0A5S6QHH5_TRIMR